MHSALVPRARHGCTAGFLVAGETVDDLGQRLQAAEEWGASARAVLAQAEGEVGTLRAQLAAREQEVGALRQLLGAAEADFRAGLSRIARGLEAEADAAREQVSKLGGPCGACYCDWGQALPLETSVSWAGCSNRVAAVGPLPPSLLDHRTTGRCVPALAPTARLHHQKPIAHHGS